MVGYTRTMGAAFFVTDQLDVDGVIKGHWIGSEIDLTRLAAGVCQATEAGAIAQAKAMRAALQQAIEGAK